MLIRKRTKSTPSDLVLTSFTPKVHKEENNFYVSQLKAAIAKIGKGLNNIALEGEYGTGKSSAIKELVGDEVWSRKYKPKIVSFLTQRMGDDKNAKENLQQKNSENRKNTEDVSSAKNEYEEDTSKKIQSEIVKQLYYGESPNLLKGTGYARSGRTYWRLSIGVALIMGMGVSAAVGLNMPNLARTVLAIFSGQYEADTYIIWSIPSRILAYLGISAALTIVINNLIAKVTSGNVEQVSFKDVSVDLLDKEADFTQQIDLIINYFRKTKRKVIIFEDLDRFNNIEIFEELRQLNILVNEAMKNEGKEEVKFIYAIKGSLIEDPVQKAKLFDMVIPIVPFISRYNLPDLFKKECDDAGVNNPGVLSISSILSRHIVDMRAIKLIINTIISYKDAFKPASEEEWRSCAAMAVLRNLAPAEFKLLVSGKSQLDDLREKAKSYRKKTVANIEEKYSVLEAIKDKETVIWKKLKGGHSAYGPDLPQKISINGKDFTLKDANTLLQIYSHAKEVKGQSTNFKLTITWNGCPSNYTPQEVINAFPKIKKEISDPELLKRREEEISAIASSNFPKENESLKGVTIVEELIENDILTEDYIRFVSRSSMSRDLDSARRFIGDAIHSRRIRKDRSLSAETAEIIMGEIDKTDLSSVGMYNYSLFDYILEENNECNEDLNVILEKAAANLDEFMDFYKNYISRQYSEVDMNKKEQYAVRLTEIVAKRYPIETLYSLNKANVDNATLEQQLYGIVLENISDPAFIRINGENFTKIAKYASQEFMLVIAKNIDKIFIQPPTREIYNDLANEIVSSEQPVSGEVIKLYIDHIDKEKIIKMIIHSDLSRDEIASVFQEMGDKKLSKIGGDSGKLIELPNQPIYNQLAGLLDELGLVTPAKQNNDPKKVKLWTK